MNALVTIRDGEVRASSADIASGFDKTHRDVVRAIDNLIKKLQEAGREDVRNFEHTAIPDRYGRPQRAYEMDRDGFSLLAMGFTGAKALEWKLKFLEAFRRMEEALSNSQATNANHLSSLHPLLQTAEGRDALWKGREQVRLMKELRGREAAMALWVELKLPLPRDFDSIIEHGTRRQLIAPKGEMPDWVAARKVRLNMLAATPLDDLFSDYAYWCLAEDRSPYRIDIFKRFLRANFGAGSEGRRNQFAVEVAAE